MAKRLQLDIDSYGVTIINSRSVGNLDKYCAIMNYFGIPYVILADSDNTAETLLGRKASKFTGFENEKFAVISSQDTDKRENGERVFFLRGDLSIFLNDLSESIFKLATKIASEGGRKVSEPLLVNNFFKAYPRENEKDVLSQLVKPLFEAGIALARR